MKKKKIQKELTVPIWIDSIKSDEDFKMTRLCYLILEADEPVEDWFLVLGPTDIPIIIYGLTVAICQPDSSKEIFDTVNTLKNLFDRIEKNINLSLEVQDLWLPNEFLDSRRQPKRGDVYRIGQGLFTAAIRFRNGRTTEAEFRNECKRIRKKPRYGARETEVFIKFNKLKIQESISIYNEKKASGCYMDYFEGNKIIKV